MRKLVRLYHGKRIPGKRCPYCEMPRNALVLRQDFYWRFKLECGHEVGGSYCLPPSELIRLGFVNQDLGPDPRALAAGRTIIEDARKLWEERKRKRWIEDNLAGGKRWL
jgi:hypothetical protein